MRTLFLKYYFRNTLWVSFYPVVFVLLELLFPFDLTALPFFFLQHTLTIDNYFTPLNEGIIRTTNSPYLKAVLLNNIISALTGIFFFCLVGMILAIYKKIFTNVSDYHVLYQFLPLLVWAISLGNVFVYLQYKWPSAMSWLSTLYKGIAVLLVFFVFLLIYKSDVLLFSGVLASGIVFMLLGYYLIYRLDD